MTDQRREYQRQWAKDHPEKIREYRKNTARRRALAEIMEERQKRQNLGKKEAMA